MHKVLNAVAQVFKSRMFLGAVVFSSVLLQLSFHLLCFTRFCYLLGFCYFLFIRVFFFFIFFYIFFLYSLYFGVSFYPLVTLVCVLGNVLIHWQVNMFIIYFKVLVCFQADRSDESCVGSEC